MLHWYLVQTRAKQEKIAEDNLQRQGYTIFLPVQQQVRRKSGRWQDREEPLFPGYLFIQINKHQQNTAPIRSTRGVLKLVRFGIELQPMPDEIVDAIRRRVMSAQLKAHHLPLKKGDRVKITGGSFQGMEAIFQAESGARRVELLLEMLGRKHKVNMERDEIGPID